MKRRSVMLIVSKTTQNNKNENKNNKIDNLKLKLKENKENKNKLLTNKSIQIKQSNLNSNNQTKIITKTRNSSRLLSHKEKQMRLQRMLRILA